METKELNNFKIEFYSEKEWNKVGSYIGIQINYPNNKYAGLVSDISEELAEKIVDKNTKDTYKDYHYDSWTWIYAAKQSFQTLSDLEYCVITKIT